MSTRNWKPVIEDVILHLLAEGLTITHVDNGWDEEFVVNTVEEAVELINEVDEANLYLENPDGKKRWVHIVMGNEPYEIVSDYTCDPLIDKATEKFSEKWVNRSCPLNGHIFPKSFIIVMLGDGEDQENAELSTRKTFPTRELAEEHTKGYSETNKKRVLIVECPRGLIY